MSTLPESPRPIVHVGLPRTGTTMLQTHLFARHSQLYYLGTLKGPLATAETRARQGCRDERVQRLMQDLVFTYETVADPGHCAVLWREVVADAADRAPLWSLETLTTDVLEVRRTRAHNLRDVLGPARIVVTLRHPVTLMESTYFQVMRREHRLAAGPNGKESGYEQIDDWLERHWAGELGPLLDSARSVEVYAEAFGDDAVQVCLFEDLARDPERYVRRLCGFMEIDSDEGALLTAGKVENASSPILLRCFSLLARTPGGRSLAGFFARWSALRPRRRRAGSATRLGEASRDRIAEATAPGHRRLAERFGLELDRYGYPM